MKTVVYLFVILLLPLSVFAQTGTSVPQKITYPVIIPDVGSCASWAACKTLCADPVNTLTCRVWAEQRGFVTTSVEKQKKLAAVISKAKETLHCATVEECKVVCAKDEFKDVCSSFAQKEGLPGGVNPKVRNVLTEINTGTLSPTVLESIRTDVEALKKKTNSRALNIKELCGQSENKEICTNIAQKMGLAGGNKLNGPGGCQSQSSCRLYCNDVIHLQECLRFGYPGPNNCTNVQSCERSCEEKGNCTKRESTVPTRTPSRVITQSIKPSVIPKEQYQQYISTYPTRAQQIHTPLPTSMVVPPTATNFPTPTPTHKIESSSGLLLTPTVVTHNSPPTLMPQVQGVFDKRSLLQIGIEWLSNLFVH